MYVHCGYRRVRTRVSVCVTILKEWNNDLANLGQQWSARCVYEHGQPMGKEGIGQNLAIATGSYTMNNAVTDWYNEVNDYDYNSGQCRGSACGHYTQVCSSV